MLENKLERISNRYLTYTKIFIRELEVKLPESLIDIVSNPKGDYIILENSKSDPSNKVMVIIGTWVVDGEEQRYLLVIVEEEKDWYLRVVHEMR